jgi:serine/tyrosine/threonine adenylyltransferase
MHISFDNSYARLPTRFAVPTQPTPVAQPQLIAFNHPLAKTLGLVYTTPLPDGDCAYFCGNQIPDGSTPVAMAYAGHQFGHFVPQLGDGRAILLGEVVDVHGQRLDIQLKGAGPTVFSRGGDGRAALGPALREYLLSEAMAALGVPTTRALALVSTGEPVFRERALPGAVVTRVAQSHLRVGTFEFFAARQDIDSLQTLTHYALQRHCLQTDTSEGAPVALLRYVCQAQATLVAHWLSLGFVHGVMNTDNCSIAGETIDYGPCAFLDRYKPDRTFSSIDRQGRYAFRNQPYVAHWNMGRLAECLSIGFAADDATLDRRLEAVLDLFPGSFEAAFLSKMRGKLGLARESSDDAPLIAALLEQLAEAQIDYTLFFAKLSDSVERDTLNNLIEWTPHAPMLHQWLERWQLRSRSETQSPSERFRTMRRSNPQFIPRNHRVEQAIAAAYANDFAPFERLARVLSQPYLDQPEHVDLQEPPDDSQWQYKTFCGT